LVGIPFYKLEEKDKQFSGQEKQEVGLKKTKPLFEELKEWCEKQVLEVKPKSAIGKAISYYLKQYDKLVGVYHDPKFELENKIRPLAMGRKNYLFAGTPNAAERLTMMCSFIASCKANKVNPFDYSQQV
jgi:hypothetical protein